MDRRALKAGARFGIVAVIRHQILESAFEIIDRTGAQRAEIDLASLHHGQGVCVVCRGQEEMLRRAFQSFNGLASALVNTAPPVIDDFGSEMQPRASSTTTRRGDCRRPQTILKVSAKDLRRTDAPPASGPGAMGIAHIL